MGVFVIAFFILKSPCARRQGCRDPEGKWPSCLAPAQMTLGRKIALQLTMKAHYSAQWHAPSPSLVTFQPFSQHPCACTARRRPGLFVSDSTAAGFLVAAAAAAVGSSCSQGTARVSCSLFPPAWGRPPRGSGCSDWLEPDLGLEDNKSAVAFPGLSPARWPLRLHPGGPPTPFPLQRGEPSTFPACLCPSPKQFCSEQLLLSAFCKARFLRLLLSLACEPPPEFCALFLLKILVVAYK